MSGRSGKQLAALVDALGHLDEAGAHLEDAARAMTDAASEATVVVHGQLWQQMNELEVRALPDNMQGVSLKQLTNLAVRYGDMAAQVNDWAAGWRGVVAEPKARL